MEEIFETFSCISLMLVHPNQVDNFIDNFKLESVIKDISWTEAMGISIEQEPMSASTEWGCASQARVWQVLCDIPEVDGKKIHHPTS